MNILYEVFAEIPFLSAVVLLKSRSVDVLSSDKSRVSADVERTTIEDPRSNAEVTMILCADEVLPGVRSHTGQESIRVVIPGVEDHELFAVRRITTV